MGGALPIPTSLGRGCHSGGGGSGGAGPHSGGREVAVGQRELERCCGISASLRVPKGTGASFGGANSRPRHANARKRHSEKGNRDHQRWRERQKRGRLTLHKRLSSHQHLLRASSWVLPQIQSPLTSASLLVLPTSSEHPVPYKPTPWPATLTQPDLGSPV